VKRFLEKSLTHLGIAVFLSATVVYLMCSGARNTDSVTARELAGIIDISQLTPTETKRLNVLLNQEVSPCGDDISLGEALRDPGGCPLVAMGFDFIVGMLKDDYNEEEISAAYMARYAALKGLEIPVDGAPRMGAEEPSISIVVFSDFECPFCAKTAERLDEIARSYPDEIEVVFKHYPIETHTTAEQAARAAFAAHQQGRFWQMHDTLFSAQGSELTRERLDLMATGLGLDMERFEEDLGSPAATAAIEADRRLGGELGVSGTPTIFINGRRLDHGIKGIDDRLKEEFLRRAVMQKKNAPR